MAAFVPLMFAWLPVGFPPNLAQAEKEVSANIGVEELKAHVYRLASPDFAGRKGPGGLRAAKHIAGQFKAMGLKPAFGPSYFQTIPDYLTDPTGKKNFLGRNVGAVIPGSDPKLKDEWIVVTGHFDHLGKRGNVMYPGADDNATSVAMVLEVAEKISKMKTPPKRTIYFVSFDLEEVGLLGSRYFAVHPPMPIEKLKTFITADMLGRSMGNVMDEYMFALGWETSPELHKLIITLPTPKGLKVGRLGSDIVGTRSDYGPFRDRDIPFLFFTTGQNPDYHTPRDLPDRIDYHKLQKICDWITDLTLRLANDEHSPTWTDNRIQDLDEVNTIRILCQRLLKEPDAINLSKGQQRFIGGMESRLATILDRGRMSAGDRTWLVWTSRYLLVSVFR